MGFLMDEAMSGMAHQDRAIAMGHSHASKAGEVASRMGGDMGMMYVKTVVGPTVLYDMELTGGQFQGERLRKVWEKLLSKATLDDERGSFVSRRDAFTKKAGLMSEMVVTPWDIQVQGRVASLCKRIRDQCDTMARVAHSKGEADGSVRQMMRMHIGLLGLQMTLNGSEGMTREWPRATKEAMKSARASRLMALKM